MVDKTIYSWTDIDQMVQSLAGDITRTGQKIDGIIGLTRGGLVPAVCLSHALNVPLHTLKVQLRDGVEDPVDLNYELLKINQSFGSFSRLLIVDDINDTGKTLRMILDHWPACNKRPLAAVLIERTTSVFAADFTAYIDGSATWAQFPWEC